jgi:hypothetical protein
VDTLSPALSHPMGEGELFPVFGSGRGQGFDEKTKGSMVEARR